MNPRPSRAAILSSLFASALLALSALPAAANLDSSVTVKGTAVTGEIIASSNLVIGFAAAAPALGVTIEADPASNAAVGDRVNLTYRIENTGNVTLSGLRLRIEQEGQGTAPVLRIAAPDNEENIAEQEPGEAALSDSLAYPGQLAPGEVALFSAEYVVVQDDLETNGGGDGRLDAHAMATAEYAGTEANAEGVLQIGLEEVRATLSIAKAADRTENLVAGDVITYTYTITNTGNVTINGISLTETHNGSGPAPRPADERLVSDNDATGDSSDREADGTWDVLGPQDVIEFTATYTVTQSDFDTLQ